VVIVPGLSAGGVIRMGQPLLSIAGRDS
jgi:hypothetical protein